MIKIVITEITEKIGPAPATFEKIADTGGEDGGAQYDYVTPPGTVTTKVERVLYEQSFRRIGKATIDAIMRAANGTKR